MIRLFLTLFSLILLTYFIAIASIDPLAEFLLNNIEDEVEAELSQGTFTLLNRSIKGLEPSQISKKVALYKTIFHPSFDRIEKSSLSFSPDELEKLAQGKTLIKNETPVDGEDPPSIHYHQSLPSSYVWKLALDIDADANDTTIYVIGGKFIEGAFYLIESSLLKAEKQQWPKIMQELQTVHGFPLHLKSQTSITQGGLTPQLLKKFDNNKVINITQGSRYVTFVRKISHSDKALQIGGIKIPWQLYYLGYFVYAFLALTVASAIFFWTRSLWLNLHNIKRAADDFGAGNYDTRIAYRKYSRLAGLSQAFNSMAEKTQQSIRSHEELTTAVSHELRTPVARMRFSLDMLSSSDDEKDNKRYIANMNDDIDEMNVLLEELLSYARLQSRDPKENDHRKFSQQALIPWLEHTMQGLIKLSQGKQLSWKVEGIATDESSAFDAELMSRLLNNLVQNAVRHAKQKIEVSLTKTPELIPSAQHYILIVDDDGTGIAEADRERLFEVFTTAESSRNKEQSGFGIGLAIVKCIVSRHQGSVMIEDSPLGGARFVVQWPSK